MAHDLDASWTPQRWGVSGMFNHGNTLGHIQDWSDNACWLACKRLVLLVELAVGVS